MGWWWMPLMLMLAPWLPRSPSIQAGPLGLWQWMVLVSWLPGVHPCLLCFQNSLQQTRLCHELTRTPANHPRHRHCLKVLAQAAVPLASVTVGLEQYKLLQGIVLDALRFLEQQKDLKPLEVSLQEAVGMIWMKLNLLGKAPGCIPPCGFQPGARVFQCSTCSFADCQLPLDCPVQDLWVTTDEDITLHCNVPFATPRHLAVTWMFAKDLRTQDLALFEELQGTEVAPHSLTLQEPTQGTFVCLLGNPLKPVVRKYFYLNVSEATVEAEKVLQARFRTVLHWPQDRSQLQQMRQLGLGLALGTMALMLLVMLLGVIWHCRSLPVLSDHQTSHRPGHQDPLGGFKYQNLP